MNIIPSKAPNLAVPSAVYDRQYEQQFHDMLRLYFAQIDNAVAALIINANNAEMEEWLEP